MTTWTWEDRTDHRVAKILLNTSPATQHEHEHAYLTYVSVNAVAVTYRYRPFQSNSIQLHSIPFHLIFRSQVINYIYIWLCLLLCIKINYNHSISYHWPSAQPHNTLITSHFKYITDTDKCDTDTCVGMSSGTAGLFVEGNVKEIGKSRAECQHVTVERLKIDINYIHMFVCSSAPQICQPGPARVIASVSVWSI